MSYHHAQPLSPVSNNFPTVITAMLGVNAFIHGLSAYNWLVYPESFLKRYSFYGDTAARLVETAENVATDVALTRGVLGWRTSVDVVRFLGATNVGLFFLSSWNAWKFWKTEKLSEGGVYALAATSFSRFILSLTVSGGSNWKQDFGTLALTDLLLAIGAVMSGLLAKQMKLERKQIKHIPPLSQAKDTTTSGRATSETAGGHTTTVQ